jgi:hypothetical protein
VSRYFVRFNKDPEKFHRQKARSGSTAYVDPYLDLSKQVLRDVQAKLVSARHNKLMSEGKFVQARLAIEAETAYEKYISSKTSSVTLPEVIS